MTADSPFDGEIASAEEFETALCNLLREATRNDIDPRGAWEYRSPESGHDWEVMVHELAPRDASE